MEEERWDIYDRDGKPTGRHLRDQKFRGGVPDFPAGSRQGMGCRLVGVSRRRRPGRRDT